MIKIFFLVVVLFQMVGWGQTATTGKTELDRAVQWGYKAFLKNQLSLEQIKGLRKTLKTHGVTILYPSERDWRLPTGYLSVSSYLEAVDLEKLSPFIVSVQSTELTRRYQLQLSPSLSKQQMKNLLKAFTRNKIQVIGMGSESEPTHFSVKTALTPQQMKEIEEVGPYIQSIEG